MENSEDDLSRAIALSLGESHATTSQTNAYTSADEDPDESIFQEQMRQAIEASKAQPADKDPVPHPNPDPVSALASTSTNTFLSERAQLEKERRERQKRLRKAQGLPDSDDERRRQDDDDNEEEGAEPSAKRQRVSPSSKAYGRTNAAPSSSKTSTPGSRQEPFFWDGEWRPTATQGVEPRKDGKPTFRLSEILGNKTDIAFAILSTFALDIPWIYSLFDPSVPVIMVAQPDASGKTSVKNVLPNWVKTTPFLRNGYGCMHMKFMLIFYKTGRLRVAISTANLIAYDWRDIENSVWVQDIPPLSRHAVFEKRNTESFQYVMKRVLDNVHVKPALSITLQQGHPNLPIQSTEDLCTRWDWSKVGGVSLVPSIAGKHEGWPNVILTGHARLMKAVRSLGLGTDKGAKAKKLELEYQGSSLGQYTTQWLNEFYHSARGESAQDWLDKPKSRRERLPYPADLKILFPTSSTVHSSQHGERGGGTIFCKRAQWEAKNFPRHLLYDSRSKAGNTLMHTKMIVAAVSSKSTSSSSREVINVDSDSDDSSEIEAIDTHVGWVYMGSHNFTPSAWGTLSGSAFNPVMNIRNYELGIVFPVKTTSDLDRIACFQRPPPKYVSGRDGPWIQDESVYFGARPS